MPWKKEKDLKEAECLLQEEEDEEERRRKEIDDWDSLIDFWIQESIIDDFQEMGEREMDAINQEWEDYLTQSALEEDDGWSIFDRNDDDGWW